MIRGAALGRESLDANGQHADPFTVSEQRDHLVAERRDIRRLQAADSIAIADYFSIHPAAARVADMVFDRMVAGRRASFGEPR